MMVLPMQNNSNDGEQKDAILRQNKMSLLKFETSYIFLYFPKSIYLRKKGFNCNTDVEYVGVT